MSRRKRINRKMVEHHRDREQASPSPPKTEHPFGDKRSFHFLPEKQARLLSNAKKIVQCRNQG